MSVELLDIEAYLLISVFEVPHEKDARVVSAGVCRKASGSDSMRGRLISHSQQSFGLCLPSVELQVRAA